MPPDTWTQGAGQGLPHAGSQPHCWWRRDSSPPRPNAARRRWRDRRPTTRCSRRTCRCRRAVPWRRAIRTCSPRRRTGAARCTGSTTTPTHPRRSPPTRRRSSRSSRRASTSGRRNAASATSTTARRRSRRTPPPTIPRTVAQPDGASVVGWGTLTDPALGAWTYAWYAQESSDRIIFDSDTTLSVTNIASLADLDRLMTHEWGHALGLDHSNTEAAIMAGPPSTHYNALVTPQPDDVRGCRCLYGLPPGMASPYVCSLPPKIDFGNAAVGRASSAQMVTFTNSGNAPLSIATSTMTNAQFTHVAGCTPGTVVPPGVELHGAGAGDAGCDRRPGGRARALHQRRLLRAAPRGQRRDGEHRQRRARRDAGDGGRVLQRLARPLFHHLPGGRAGEPRRGQHAHARGRARASRSVRTPRRRRARARCAASTFRRRTATRTSSGATRRMRRVAGRAPGLRAGGPGVHARVPAHRRRVPRRDAAALSPVQQSRRRQPSLHDRACGARPDGRQGLGRRGRRSGRGGDVRAARGRSRAKAARALSRYAAAAWRDAGWSWRSPRSTWRSCPPW